MEGRNPPDLRDWSRLTSRVRLGAITEISAFLLISAWLAVGALTIGVAVGLIGCSILLLIVVFDGRRPWWPPEPGAPYYDPLAVHARRSVVLGVSLIAVGLVATVLGIR